MTGRERAALLVIDLQHDFCTGPVVAARFGGDTAKLDAVTANAARAVDVARAHGVEVVFVRFLGDLEHQGPSWRRRDQALGKQPKCLDGSRGAEFHRVSPAPGERVFTKRACFDAFLSDGFAGYLDHRGFDRLVFAGVYADVCVDSTARTAFQKGFHITVLADCTTSLHGSDEEVLRFMGALYGARVTTLAEEENAWSTSSQERPEWNAASA